MLINEFLSIKDSSVHSSIELTEILNRIKSDELNHKKINYIRSLKECDTTEYKFMKSRLPIVCFNFTFNNFKRNENIIKSTGLIYLDIDKEYNIEKLDKTKVYSYWKSVGGKGWGILVKCNNVTLENFKETYLNVVKELNIEDVYDIGARKATQPCFISSDENIYINDDSYTFDANALVIKTINNKHIKTESSYIIEHSNHISKIGINSNRPTDEELMKMPEWSDKLGGCYFKDNKFPLIQLNFPRTKIIESKRNYTLSAMMHTYIWLNEIYTKHNFSKEHYYTELSKWNQLICQNPLQYDEIIKIVNNCLYYLKKGTLQQPKPYKLRTFIFHSTTLQLKSIKSKNFNRTVNNSRQQINQFTKENNDTLIIQCIENWNFIEKGLISQSKISKEINLSIKSLSKKWLYYKDTIEMLNKENEESINNYKINKKKQNKNYGTLDINNKTTSI